MRPFGEPVIAPSKNVPRIPSWIQISPGASFPSAYRQAILALVPVPHGERSKDAPGQSTKFREELPGDRGGAKNSMWSIRAPPSPVMPESLRAERIAVEAATSSARLANDRSNGWSPMRKNQFPAQ